MVEANWDTKVRCGNEVAEPVIKVFGADRLDGIGAGVMLKACIVNDNSGSIGVLAVLVLVIIVVRFFERFNVRDILDESGKARQES